MSSFTAFLFYFLFLVLLLLLFFFLAYDKACLNDLLSKWKQGIQNGDVVVSYNSIEKSENPYLPFVGKCRKLGFQFPLKVAIIIRL